MRRDISNKASIIASIRSAEFKREQARIVEGIAKELRLIGKMSPVLRDIWTRDIPAHELDQDVMEFGRQMAYDSLRREAIRILKQM